MIEKHSTTVRPLEEKTFDQEVEKIADEFSQVGNIFKGKDGYTKDNPSEIKRQMFSFQSRGALGWFRK